MEKNKVIEFTPEFLSESNFGLYLIRDDANVVKSPDYSATVVFKLVYFNKTVSSHLGEDLRYGWCNVLTDGWVLPIAKDRQGLCDFLNGKDGKYRVLTQEELLHILNHKTNIRQLVKNLDED